MAICPKCGKELADGVKFCGACGHKFDVAENPEKKEAVNTEEIKEAAAEALEKGKEVAGEALEKGKELVGNVAEAAKNVDVNEVLAQAKAGNKKVIAIAVAAVVVVVLLIGTIFGGGGYMDPINNYMKAINKQEKDYMKLRGTLQGGKISKANKKIMDAMIDSGAEMYGESFEDYYEELSDNMEDMYDEVLDEYDSYKVTFEKKSAEKMDKDDLEDIAESLNDRYEDAYEDYEDMLSDDDDLEDFADSYDIDEKDAEKIIKAQVAYYKQLATAKVSAGYEVKGKFIVKVDGKDEYETETVKFTVVKINGEWVYVGCEDYIDLDEDGDEEAYVLDQLLSGLNSSPF